MSPRKLIGLGIASTLAFGLVVILGFGSSQHKLGAKSQRRQVDVNRFPIADFSAPEPTNADERAKRRIRGQKYNKSDWMVNPNAPSDTTVRVDSVDRNLPAIPLSRSTTVVIGKIVDSQAYLSNDKTGIYSVFKVEIQEVLKNMSPVSINFDTQIEIEREGGRVKFPSGRVHTYMTNEQNMPRVGARYVLFLSTEGKDSSFRIVTGYEISEGKVLPLDELPKTKEYEDVDEITFINEIRTKILNP